MNRWAVLLTVTLCGTVILINCSGSGNNPVSPGDPEITGASNVDLSAPNLWGYYDVYIDAETGDVEVVSNRNTEFTANVTKFINNPPSNLGFKINGIDPTTDYIDIDIDVSVTHPFAGLTEYNGYDVRGVFMAPGDQSIVYQNLLTQEIGGSNAHMYDYESSAFVDPYAGPVGMPDGYTRWFNPKEFDVPSLFGYVDPALATPGYKPNLTAEVNPYKYFADGLDPEQDLWNFLEANEGSNGVFSAGSTNTRNYYLRFTKPTGIKFGYAIIANWKGTDPADHPDNAVESMSCLVDNSSTIYYVDDGNKGGDLVLDIHTWSWEVQPTRILVGSTVLSGPVEVTTSVPGGTHWVTWQVNTPADNITKAEGNEFWVICEFDGYDYKNELQIPNNAGDDPLATFFRFDLPVSGNPDCQTQVVSVDPDIAQSGSMLDNVMIEVTELEVGPNLDARLKKSGSSDIVGTDVQFVDSTHLTADFNLAGASKGMWDLQVTNGCGGIPGTASGIFEVTGGLILIDTGTLPGPEPTSDLANLDFSVQGDDTNGFDGVFYYWSDGTPANYQVYSYPLDYSADGTQVYQLDLTWNGDTLGGPEMMNRIEMGNNGYTFISSLSTDTNFYDLGDYETRTTYFICDDTGYISISNFWWDCPFMDFDNGFGDTPEMWSFWGYDFELTPDGYESKVFHPYDDLALLTEFDTYFPVDYVGSVNSEVSDQEAYRFAIDTEPQGLSSGYDRINYYLEGAPDDPVIEVFANSQYGPNPLYMTTIDGELMGAPVDISCLNAYGNISDATGNYLCVLEDNGDSTYQVAIFDQDGGLIARYDTPLAGDAIALDVDIVNLEIHVWADNGGTLEYAKFGYY
ncbi:MAG TPA: hypothetical protein VGB30_06880 [bacterium]|jgi:hypothetical protein